VGGFAGSVGGGPSAGCVGLGSSPDSPDSPCDPSAAAGFSADSDDDDEDDSTQEICKSEYINDFSHLVCF